MRQKKLIHGVGINDSELCSVTAIVDGKRKIVWRCPIHRKWAAMLERCYSPSYKKNKPSYNDVTVCPEWHRFSNFKAWMTQQDWEGKHLDKDLLSPDSKVYSPSTCCFVRVEVNSFMTEANSIRGDWPLGVHYERSRDQYGANVSIKGKTVNLGRFQSPVDAHYAWLKRKIELADELAENEADPRIANALRARYRNYVDPLLATFSELPMAA